MKAIVVREFGGPEVMKLEDVPEPSPGPGQVTIRVRAVGVNPVDAYIRSGTYARKPNLPYTPGTDMAGTVEAVGSGADGVKPGDRVYAHAAVGGYARGGAVRGLAGAPAARARLVRAGRRDGRAVRHRLAGAVHPRAAPRRARSCWSTAAAAAWARRRCRSRARTACR